MLYRIIFRKRNLHKVVVQIVGIAGYISVEAKLLRGREEEQENQAKTRVLGAKCKREVGELYRSGLPKPSLRYRSKWPKKCERQEQVPGCRFDRGVPEPKTLAMPRQRRAEVPYRVTCFGTEAKL